MWHTYQRKPDHLVYVHPRYQLTENIHSHRISAKQFTRFYQYYEKQGQYVTSIQTRYYYKDLIYNVDYIPSYGYSLPTVLRSETVTIDHSYDPIWELRVERVQHLTQADFPASQHYHHERQAIKICLYESDYIVALEVLLRSKKAAPEMSPLIPSIIKSLLDGHTPDSVLSLSIRFYSRNQEEAQFQRHLSVLKKLLGESDEVFSTL